MSTSVARADNFRLNAGLGGGLMMSDDQLDWLGYDGIAGRGWLTLGHALSEHWVLEGHGSSGAFGSSGRDGGLFELGAGMRFDLITPLRTMHLTSAAHINLGITGGLARPSLSAQVGLLLDLSRAWALGPLLQYGQVFQPDERRYSTDARYFTFGIGIGYRPAPDEPPDALEPERVLVEHTMIVHERGAEPDPPQTPEPSEQLLLLIDSAVKPLADESKLIPPVLFEHDSVALIPCGEAALYYARDAINQRTGPVRLEGHADSTGDLDYNLDLAQRRAEVVRAWLIEHGVALERLRVESRGECCNLANETDDAQRQINRRVIIHFEDPQ